MGQSVSSKRSRKRPTLGGDLEELAREITRLLTLEAPALRERWASIFGNEPSPNLGRALLIRAIAYRLQEKASAGLKPSTQRVLDRTADNRSKDAPQSTPQRQASAGTVLIREWRGVSHRVTVLDHEVVYRERRYKSLSGSRPRDHRLSLVGAAVLRSEGSRQGGRQWLVLPDDVQSTPASPRKKDWSRTTTRCMRSARRARRSSEVRRVKVGG